MLIYNNNANTKNCLLTQKFLTSFVWFSQNKTDSQKWVSNFHTTFEPQWEYFSLSLCHWPFTSPPPFHISHFLFVIQIGLKGFWFQCSGIKATATAEILAVSLSKRWEIKGISNQPFCSVSVKRRADITVPCGRTRIQNHSVVPKTLTRFVICERNM